MIVKSKARHELICGCRADRYSKQWAIVALSSTPRSPVRASGRPRQRWRSSAAGWTLGVGREQWSSAWCARASTCRPPVTRTVGARRSSTAHTSITRSRLVVRRCEKCGKCEAPLAEPIAEVEGKRIHLSCYRPSNW